MGPRWVAGVALAGFAAWTAIALVTWGVSRPLGHDEAQYALAAADTLAGTPARWFYLSRGMNALAIPGVLLGGSDHALRFLSLVCGFGFAIATYQLARRAVGPVAAAWTLVVLAGARTIVRLSTDLLSDMPAAAALLMALALIVDEIDRLGGVRWRIVAVAPLAACAFYVRYGSVIPIAVLVVAALLVGARTVAHRPLPVIATAVVFLLCLVPHFVESTALTGSPLGILRWSSEVPDDETSRSGLVTYLTTNPFRYYGLLMPFVLVAGVGAGVPALLARDRRRIFVWLVAVGSIIAMGLTAHGMVRYIIAPLALLIALGTDLVIRGLTRIPEVPRRILAVAIATALAIVWVLTIRRASTADAYREHRMRGTLAAVRVIASDAHDRPCTVIGYHYTQLAWYSGCAPAVTIPEDAARDAQAAGRIVYVVTDHTPTWVEQWKPVLALLPAVPHILFINPDVEVVRLEPRP